MSTAGLFPIAKIQKQPKGPRTDERMKKKWYAYAMEHFLTIKKHKILPFATTWMNVEDIMLSELSRRRTNTILPPLCVESEGKQNKTKQVHRYREQIQIVVARGRG